MILGHLMELSAFKHNSVERNAYRPTKLLLKAYEIYLNLSKAWW